MVYLKNTIVKSRVSAIDGSVSTKIAQQNAVKSCFSNRHCAKGRIIQINVQVFKGYHGTAKQFEAGIIRDGFIPKFDCSLRYGPGVYFFIEGLTKCPITDAANWAITHRPKEQKTTHFVVFEAIIKVDEEAVFDFRIREHLDAFNNARRMMEAFMADSEYEHIDYATIQLLNQTLHYQCVIAEMAFNPKSVRNTKFFTYIANSTVLCLCPHAQKCIDGIGVVKEGSLAS